MSYQRRSKKERFFLPPRIERSKGTTLYEIHSKNMETEEGEVNIIITKEIFQHYWHRMKARTFFFYSGKAQDEGEDIILLLRKTL